MGPRYTRHQSIEDAAKAVAEERGGAVLVHQRSRQERGGASDDRQCRKRGGTDRDAAVVRKRLAGSDGEQGAESCSGEWLVLGVDGVQVVFSWGSALELVFVPG